MKYPLETIIAYVVIIPLTSALGALVIGRFSRRLSFRARFFIVFWIFAQVAVSLIIERWRSG